MAETTKSCSACKQALHLEEFNRRAASKDGLDSKCKACRRKDKAAYYAANRKRLTELQRQKRASGQWGVRRRPDQTEPSADGKICSGCGTSKSYKDFNRRAASADGLQPRCRACERAAKAARYRANRERLLADMAERHAANPEKKRNAARTWAALHPEEVRLRVRMWQLANPDKVREYARTTQARYPAKRREITRRRRARLRSASSLPFTVEQLELRLSMFGGCWICGGAKQAVDHVKPLAKGGAHILANLRPICVPCNSRKADRWPIPTAPVRSGRVDVRL